MKQFECRYGYFEGDEYVITDPNTPRPWYNVISNGDYSMLISQTGGGYSFRNNSEQNRLTRSFMDIVKDNWGKYFYIRNLDTGEVWSAAWNPVRDGMTDYKVRHGVGYTVIERTQNNGVMSKLKCFVSADKPLEFFDLSLTNNTGKECRLDVTSYFEWAAGLAYDNHREFQKLFYNTEFKDNAILATKCLWGFPDSKGRHNNDEWPFTGFLTVSQKAKGFDTDKETFIGMYGSEVSPKGMSVNLEGRKGRYVDPCAALRTEVTLKPGETKRVVYVLGMAENGKEPLSEYLKLANEKACDTEFAALQKFWKELLGEEKVKTNDPALDIMTNTWARYQAISCRIWAKSAAYQISGGIGYRDQLQDSLLFLEFKPELTRKQLLLHATKQFQAGDVLHWWLTIKSWGPRTKCSDDFLWLPYVAHEYWLETGDDGVYNEVEPFVDGGEASFYEHCKRAIDLSFSRLSPRGIPLMGDHDWNDGLSAVGNEMKGESFWVAEFLYFIVKNFIGTARRRGDNEYADKLAVLNAKLKEDFNKCAWDGEWFLMATNDEGRLLGSKTCEEGKIFLNPQIWAVISGICDDKAKLNKAMESVKKHLLKDYGALLLSPEYKKPDSEVGYITRYAAGLRENGGVYSHAATWAVWAFSLIGDADTAYKAYKRICPPNRTADIDKYKAEPYVMPGNSDGPVSPYYGKGGWTWYTGSAQWIHRVAVHYLLGITPAEGGGIAVKPCVPKGFGDFEYTRRHRGVLYNFTVMQGKNKGIKVDGKPIEGNIVPHGKGTVKVEVVI